MAKSPNSGLEELAINHRDAIYFVEELLQQNEPLSAWQKIKTTLENSVL